MSTLRATLNDGKTEQVLILRGPSTPSIAEAIDLLAAEPSLKSELDIVQNFLGRTGVTVSVETPDSSWVERIHYNEVNKEISFEASGGSLLGYTSKFEGFLEALQTDSAGSLAWKYKRGER